VSGQTRSRCPADALSLRLPTGVIGVALTWHAISPGTVRGEAQKGFVLLEVAVPSLLTTIEFSMEEKQMGAALLKGPQAALGMEPSR